MEGLAFCAVRLPKFISLSSQAKYNVIFRIVNNLISSIGIMDGLSRREPTPDYRDSVNIQNVNCIMDRLLAGQSCIAAKRFIIHKTVWVKR